MKDGIKVFTASLAKKLLKKGYTVVDIKQDKQDPDGKRSIFIFKEQDGLEEEIRKNINK